MNRHIPFPPHREYRFYQGLLASSIANGIQALNFLGDRFLRKSHAPAGIDALYRHSVNSAFAPNEAFLVTGAPHASPTTRGTLPGFIPMFSIPRPSWIPRTPSAGFVCSKKAST
jgi:hypothetical protein